MRQSYSVLSKHLETLSLILKEKYRLRVLEKRKILRSKREEIKLSWSKLHNEELHGDAKAFWQWSITILITEFLDLDYFLVFWREKIIKNYDFILRCRENGYLLSWIHLKEPNLITVTEVPLLHLHLRMKTDTVLNFFFRISYNRKSSKTLQLHNLYSSEDDISMFKSKIMGSVGHVYMGEMRNPYQICLKIRRT